LNPFLIGFLTLMSPLAILAQPIDQAVGRELAEVLRHNVVSIRTERTDGGQSGFGFIVGEHQGQLYIVTANHVVRSDQPDVVEMPPENWAM
jgi:S1-C subfamily serine protease